MAIAEVGGSGYYLPEGVDSRASAGLFLVVGCSRGADLEPLIVKAFADAARRCVSIDLWEKAKNGWVQVAPPAA